MSSMKIIEVVSAGRWSHKTRMFREFVKDEHFELPMRNMEYVGSVLGNVVKLRHVMPWSMRQHDCMPDGIMIFGKTAEQITSVIEDLGSMAKDMPVLCVYPGSHAFGYKGPGLLYTAGTDQSPFKTLEQFVRELAADKESGKKPRQMKQEIVYFKQHKARLVAKYPNLSILKVYSYAVAEYRALPDAEKQKYQEEARVDERVSPAESRRELHILYPSERGDTPTAYDSREDLMADLRENAGISMVEYMGTRSDVPAMFWISADSDRIFHTREEVDSALLEGVKTRTVLLTGSE